MTQDWLSKTVETFSEFESPARYYYWSSLAAVSAIVKDRVYFDRYLYKLYPNIYVLLFGPSAIKKGPPISLAKDIVTKVGNTRVINGRASVEGIMKELGTSQSSPGKPPNTDSCGFIVSSELSSSVVGSSSSLDILTDLFDRIYNDGEWTYRLKNSEPIKLKNPTVTWLAGTNEALFREFIPEKNLKGGLIGRTFVISEHKENRLNSLMEKPLLSPNRQDIADGIKHLANIRGEFRMEDDVRVAFKTWYHKFREDVAPKLEDDTGTVGRIDDNILKLAMLISCARRADLIINIDDIQEAMKEILQLIAPTKKVTSNAKQNEVTAAEKRSIILKHLANCADFRDNKVNMLMRFTLKMDHEDLDKVVSFLEQARVLKSVRVGNEIWYELNMQLEKVQEYVKEYQR
tara:strand:- start:687 stop:1895 length:1209 start_codon:yes stop_codon:yes gene_type:complete